MEGYQLPDGPMHGLVQSMCTLVQASGDYMHIEGS